MKITAALILTVHPTLSPLSLAVLFLLQITSPWLRRLQLAFAFWMWMTTRLSWPPLMKLKSVRMPNLARWDKAPVLIYYFFYLFFFFSFFCKATDDHENSLTAQADTVMFVFESRNQDVISYRNGKSPVFRPSLSISTDSMDNVSAWLIGCHWHTCYYWLPTLIKLSALKGEMPGCGNRKHFDEKRRNTSATTLMQLGPCLMLISRRVLRGYQVFWHVDWWWGGQMLIALWNHFKCCTSATV